VSVSAGAIGLGLFAGAGFLAVLAIILLTITLALGLEALGLPGWLSFLIVAVFLLIVGVVLAVLGRRSFQKVGPPRRTIASVQDAKEILQRGETPAVTPSRD
jgi:membrane protein implicated in regulation of membrane protease activity